MEETTVKQLLKTTNTVLIMIMLLLGANLAVDVLGLKSQALVIKNHTIKKDGNYGPGTYQQPLIVDGYERKLDDDY